MRLAYDDLIQPTIVKQVSKQVAYCRCTRTKNPPFCDGSHVVTNITPHILEFDSPTTIAICRCWKSKSHPYCDGTHGRLVKPKERPSPREEGDFRGGTMVEMKNPIQEANAHPEIRHLSLWRTNLAYFWVINCEPNVQDDMHYHENDDHIFMVLEGECTVRTPHKEFVLKQFDTVLLESGQAYQLCNTGKGRLLLLGAGNTGVDGKPRTRVPKIASHLPLSHPVVA